MKITSITSHLLKYDLPDELGYSQQYYATRSAHLVEVRTDEGITGWGECFGPNSVAIVNRTLIEEAIAPMAIGRRALDRAAIWHDVYNLMRDHGQKGMLLEALSGLDIALWDIAAKASNLPLHDLIGGRFRDRIGVYGYGMMLRREDPESLAARFADEASAIKEAGFKATKMKIGLGPKDDVRLVEAVRRAVGDDYQLMVDANHCYSTDDALYVGRLLDDAGVYWFEEPVAPEDREGYCELRNALKVKIAGGEAEFARWSWRRLLEMRCLDIAQPEVCALGGISEYLKVLALAQAHFTPVVNHVWGSAVAVAVNLHLLAAMPPMPGGLHPTEPLLEFDTTHNLFLDKLAKEPLAIQEQVGKSRGYVAIPQGPGHGVEPDVDFLKKYAI